ncbi:Galactosylceramide sulfotransferaselike [Caligus rogercresseyi]|uniref:Galactosylceramide sulfotransferaselike n=1 Tax=Caligus rogercresseyi TaxID=217165 RepID=A0A7T8GMS0_CALRO|nr:Galactosylceramide sulfotransferaselike [Caligus rogercresseyi]
MTLKEGILEPCKARTSIAFSKTHKVRFMSDVAIANHRSFTFMSFSFQLWKRFIDNTIWGKANISFDLFGIHAIWNHSEVAALMKPDTVYVTILREPLELFFSQWGYFEMENIFGSNDFIKLNDSMKTSLITEKISMKSIGHNQMLRDLGLPPKDLDKPEAIQSKIEEVDKNFDLIMIAEHFDESLILFKELLCWSFDDITNLKLNSRNSESKERIFHNTTKEKARSSLRNWLRGDFMLYEYFHEKFHRVYIPRIMGVKNMTHEVNYLRAKNLDLMNKCVLKTVQESHDIADSKFQLWKKDLVGYEMAERCELYGLKETVLVDMVRDEQKKRIIEAFNVTIKP